MLGEMDEMNFDITMSEMRKTKNVKASHPQEVNDDEKNAI